MIKVEGEEERGRGVQRERSWEFTWNDNVGFGSRGADTQYGLIQDPFLNVPEERDLSSWQHHHLNQGPVGRSAPS